MSDGFDELAALPPPIAQLMRMTQMSREILSTSHGQLSQASSESMSDALYGPVAFEHENIMRADIAAKVMFDPTVASRITTLFSRYRGSGKF